MHSPPCRAGNYIPAHLIHTILRQEEPCVTAGQAATARVRSRRVAVADRSGLPVWNRPIINIALAFALYLHTMIIRDESRKGTGVRCSLETHRYLGIGMFAIEVTLRGFLIPTRCPLS